MPPPPPLLQPIPSRIRRNRAYYLPFLRGRRRVLDVGCAEGIFLELLREAGSTVRGVEKDPEAAAVCRGKGLDCVRAEASTWLGSCADRFDAVVLTHVLEHHAAEEGRGLMAASSRVLSEGGILLAVVPNYGDFFVASRDFWADPTHVEPHSLDAIASWAGVCGLRERTRGEHPQSALTGLSWPQCAAGLLTKAAHRLMGRRVFCGDLYILFEKTGAPCAS